VYAEETAPLEAFFRKGERLMEIDGVGDVDEVAGRVAAAFDSVVAERMA
jgi:adenylate kinase